MDVDPDLPSVQRVVAYGLLRRQPAEIRKMVVENLSFREQVQFAVMSANKHEDWTALLLVNDLNAESLYTEFTGWQQGFAISDVLFSQPEFQYEVSNIGVHGRTGEELKHLATHSRDFNMGVDRPSNATKRALRIPRHNREAWPSLIARVQNNEMMAFLYSKVREEEGMVRYLASSRPQRLLDGLVDLSTARGGFMAAPYDTICAGKICDTCFGPELERRFIPLVQLQRFLAKEHFSQRGMIAGFEHLCYSDLTTTGGRTEKYTWILCEHASVVTQARFGRNFDDVMYLLDNGKVPRDVRKRVKNAP
ncbi:hypothetical protein Q7P35_005980 [Cladosporium inversicolor]